jgi:hypothetical protein
MVVTRSLFPARAVARRCRGGGGAWALYLSDAIAANAARALRG